MSVGAVNWLRIQRPSNFKLISDWGKKFLCYQKKFRLTLWARVARGQSDIGVMLSQGHTILTPRELT